MFFPLTKRLQVTLQAAYRLPSRFAYRRAVTGRELSRPDPCSADFGRETPKFRFEFCRGFVGGFFLLFSKEKGHKTKNPPKIPPAKFFGKIPLEFLQKPFLDELVGTNLFSTLLTHFQAHWLL